MCNDDSLLSIGNAVGKVIKVDPNTIDMVRGRYTRVYVELNLNKPLMSTVVVWRKEYFVKYEGLQRIYFKCGCYGHKMEPCMATSVVNSKGDAGEESMQKQWTRGTATQTFGPWMLPTHVRRKQ